MPRIQKGQVEEGRQEQGILQEGSQAHICEEWNSDEESSSSEEEEEVANVAIQSTSTSQLFTNLSEDSYTPTCLMTKGDKVTLFNDDFTNDDDEQLVLKKN